MNINNPLTLLGGISPEVFMRRYWQKKPLLVRQAVPGVKPLLSRAELLALAAREDVESRLVTMQRQGLGKKAKEIWNLQRGPFKKKDLPSFQNDPAQSVWTVLVQGVDLHHEAVHALMNQFRFIPDARLDDLMISYAVEGGGVGPHYDSYDVFLLQTHGKRHWRIGSQQDLALKPDMSVKILKNFRPEQEWVLEPGDMLYLPPQYAHDGVAVGGDCMTYSIGFRVPKTGELAQELLQRLAEDALESAGETLYQDPNQSATAAPAAVPEALLRFAKQAVKKALNDPKALERALGEVLTEPKPLVWFEASDEASGKALALDTDKGIALDRRTRMMHDEAHIYINGESYEAAGKDAALMRRLADERRLSANEVHRASRAAKTLLAEWQSAGWVKSIGNLDE